MSSGSQLHPPQLVQTLEQIMDAKIYTLCGFCFLLYDHILTLPEEIETIWKTKKTFVSYLYLFLRYYAPLSYAIVLVAYFNPVFTGELCHKFILFQPLGTGIPLMMGPGILMALRVYAMYDRSRILLFCLFLFLGGQLGIGLWDWASTSHYSTTPNPVNDSVHHICVFVPGRSRTVGASFVLTELAYDATIFALTVLRTTWVHYRWPHTELPVSSLWSHLMANGALYFGFIFSSNLSWALMILHAPVGIRALPSMPSVAFNVTFISRITLNLRTSMNSNTNAVSKTVLSTFEAEDIDPSNIMGLSELGGFSSVGDGGRSIASPTSQRVPFGWPPPPEIRRQEAGA